MKKLIIIITFFSFATSNIYSQLNNPAISKDTLEKQGKSIIVLQKNIFNQYKKFKSGKKIYKIKELEKFLESNSESYILYQKHINLDKKSKISTSTFCLLAPILGTSFTISSLMALSPDSNDEARKLGGLISLSSIFVYGYLSRKSTKLEKESIHTLEKAVLSYNIAIDKNYRLPIENDNQRDFYRKLFSLFFMLL
tara:strand:+ start:951 stop:1538 length:588 start_codon:yes stop_codon:yes gene_type:complete